MNFMQAFDETFEEVEEVVKEPVVRMVGVITSRQGHFSGQLRASNNVGLNNPDLSIVEVANYRRNAIGRTTDLAKAHARSVLRAFKMGDAIIVSNNQPYAIHDEFRNGRLAYEIGADSFEIK